MKHYSLLPLALAISLEDAIVTPTTNNEDVLTDAAAMNTANADPEGFTFFDEQVSTNTAEKSDLPAETESTEDALIV